MNVAFWKRLLTVRYARRVLSEPGWGAAWQLSGSGQAKADVHLAPARPYAHLISCHAATVAAVRQKINLSRCAVLPGHLYRIGTNIIIQIHITDPLEAVQRVTRTRGGADRVRAGFALEAVFSSGLCGCQRAFSDTYARGRGAAGG